MRIPIHLKISLAMLLAGSLARPSGLAAGPAWEDRTEGLFQADTTAVAIGSDENPAVYAATADGSLYQTTGAGPWRRVALEIPAGTRVYKLKLDPALPGTLYAATGHGLYAVTENRARQVFAGPPGEDAVTAVALNHAGETRRIYAGTSRGLYILDSDERMWRRSGGELGERPIGDIAVHPLNPRTVLVATDHELWRSVDRGLHWEKRFAMTQDHEREETRADAADEAAADADALQPRIHTILFGTSDPDRVYLGTEKGVFFSQDLGETWEHIPEQGLLDRNVKTLTTLPQSDDRMLAGTEAGVFAGDARLGSWREFYKGMTARDIRGLAVTRIGPTRVWAATENGVFVYDPETDLERLNLYHEIKPVQLGLGADELLDAFSFEPEIQEVQEAAIRYAEVHPDKILHWRRRARLAAFMPELGLGWDRTRTVEIDRGGTNDPDTFILGPEEKGVDVSFSWDIAKLIWNDDETSIDTRSKLMVQLRDDILDEVNRVYFERRRIQTEVYLSPAQDVQEEVDRRLRVEELTAQLDGLTGGYFTGTVERNVRN